jgi:hypothetical protein
MNDLERMIRETPLREPPADLRAAILSAARRPPVTAERSDWRALFWPSPLAWAALALLWVGMAILDRSGARDAESARQAYAATARPASVLLALQSQAEQTRLLEGW